MEKFITLLVQAGAKQEQVDELKTHTNAGLNDFLLGRVEYELNKGAKFICSRWPFAVLETPEQFGWREKATGWEQKEYVLVSLVNCSKATNTEHGLIQFALYDEPTTLGWDKEQYESRIKGQGFPKIE